MKNIFLSLMILSLIFIPGCSRKKPSNPSKIIVDTPYDLYRAPVDIDSPDIVEAIKEGNLQKVREMIEQDRDIASGIIKYPCEYYDWSLLLVSVRFNNKDISNLLIKSGADVIRNGYYSDETPLHIAAEYNAKDVAELLIKSGADVNAEGSSEQTPLHTAAFYNSREVAEILIANGARIDALDYFCGCHNSGNNPLHYAVWGGSKDVIRLLVEKGADINAKNAKGETPLFNSIILTQEKKAEMFIKLGAKVDVKNNEGNTPLDITQDIRVERLLIKAGADVSRYPFHYAILMEDIVKVKKFISEGVDINKKGKNFTPIEYAVFTGNMDIVELLINEKANLVESNPLFMAVSYDRVEIAEFLIKKGADINAIIIYNNEYTLLDIARSQEMRRLLVKYGAKSRNVEKVRMF